MASTLSPSLLPALLLAVACGSSNGGVSDVDAAVSAGDASTAGDAAAPPPGPTTDASPSEDGGPLDAVNDASDGAAADAPSSGYSLDGSLDAGYALCGTTIDPSLKACATDGDCAYETHLTDCCGGILYVGVAQSSVAAFAQCERAWEAHFPACGCFSLAKKTEDGKCLVGGNCPASDASPPAGATPQVHCVTTGETGLCETSLP